MCNVHSQVYNTSSSQHGTQGAAPDQTYRISQHQFYWRTTLGIASHMLKISGATRSKKDYQRANIQPTIIIILMGNNGWKFPGVCPLRSTEGELISDCRCKRARRMPPPTLWASVEFVWVCILLLSTSASECDVCRLRCVSLCALLVGVTHTISVIHIVFSRKSLCVAWKSGSVKCWTNIMSDPPLISVRNSSIVPKSDQSEDLGQSRRNPLFPALPPLLLLAHKFVVEKKSWKPF